MKILLVGENAKGYALGIMHENLLKQGNQAELINTHKYFKTSLLNRVVNKLLKTPHYFGSGIKELNRAVLERGRTGGFEYILFLKPIMIFPETIAELKKHAKIVGLYMDHVGFPKTGSDYFYKSIPLFDLYMSSIPSNVPAMLKFGAKKSIYFSVFADPICHHRVVVSPEDVKKYEADVIFVGTYADEKGHDGENRAKYMERLCRDGYNVHIYGNGWQKLSPDSCLRKQNRITPGNTCCEDMAKVMGASKIMLAFMRKHNDEKIGCRTYEIPLCGGFMLHERTEEAEKLLAPGKEAEFFDSYEEMKGKIDFYLKHPELRLSIAKAGEERILNSGELMRDMMRKLPEILKKEIG